MRKIIIILLFFARFAYSLAPDHFEPAVVDEWVYGERYVAPLTYDYSVQVYSGEDNAVVLDEVIHWPEHVNEVYLYAYDPLLDIVYGWHFAMTYPANGGGHYECVMYINGAKDPNDPIVSPGNTNLPPVIVEPPEMPTIIITNFPPVYPDLPEWPELPVYEPVDPVLIVPPTDPQEPGNPQLPELPEIKIPTPVVTNITINPPDIVIENPPPDLGPIGEQIGQLIEDLNESIADQGGSNDGSQGDDGSGTGEEGASGGNTFIKGIDPSVYAALIEANTAAMQNAMTQQNLSAEEIALRIHEVLTNLGINGDSIKLGFQEALDAQGVSSYQFNLAVKDALYSAKLTGPDMYAYMDSALQHQNLSASEIAREIKSALGSAGVSVTGIEEALTAALENRDLSAGNFQTSFEVALNNQGLNSSNIEKASEQALAKRNLSAAEIAREIGNQMLGLGLSTKENDDLNVEKLIQAIHDGTNAPPDLQKIIDSFSAEINEEDYEYSVDPLAFDENNFTVPTNAIIARVNSVSSELDSDIESHKRWVNELFNFDPPTIGKNYNMRIDLNASGLNSSVAGGLRLPVYNLDLSSPSISRFRSLEVFCVWVSTLLTCAYIAKCAFTK